jgi:NadR type nicotinamide-nucleotide adenylyltransferase
VTTGLTLGKYAPLHARHQDLIDRARSEVDHLIVVIYQAPSTTTIPLAVRAQWIRDLYPDVEVIEAPDGPEATGMDERTVSLQNAYLTQLLKGRKIDAFFSSEPYGVHVARALDCENRTVDRKRSGFGISATQIRSALAASFSMSDADVALVSRSLHPRVCADVLPRIVLLGGPSTGKTTTAAALAEHLHEPLCLEYGREYWFAHQEDHRLSMADLEAIAHEQVVRDRSAAADASRFVVSDTSPLTTWAYAKYYFGEVSADLTRIMEAYHAQSRFVVVCDTDIPFDDTWDRSGPGSRDELQAINIEALERLGIPLVIARGPTARRVETIVRHVRSWRYQC